MIGSTEEQAKKKEAEKAFALGQVYMKRKSIHLAHKSFGIAHTLQPKDQRYRSYYGLTTAVAARDLKQALSMCSEAMKNNYIYPDLYCNLGRIYLMMGKRKKAHDIFKAGLRLDASNRELRGELRKMGRRKHPAFSFLKRTHFLNQLTGKIRQTLISSKR